MKPTFKLLCLLLFILSLSNSTLAIAEETPLLLHAARVFDGTTLRTNTSVLISNGKIVQIDQREAFKSTVANVIDLGDATLLPSLIELHAHLAYQHIPADTVLRHGIGTLRDVGGTVHQPYGGDGSLRVLTSGQIITAPNGYPIPTMGADNLAIPVASEAQARQTVRELIKGGAVVIKIALETGNEVGAPWSSEHHHGHSDPHAEHGKPPHAMPLLSEAIVKAIVDEAHQHQLKVTAHLAETKGVTIALNAGVDEWAHTPCDAIPETLLKKAVDQGVKIVTTLDTLSKCSGVAHNAHTWAALGGEFLYGSEIAHPEIPWGIDAQELNLMMQLAKLSPLEVLHTATAKAGQHLNIPLLGTLQSGAPADLIAVKGDAMHNFKPLEYPDLVISGGKIIVNHFEK
ncbi:MAG: amidohydrolase family protein [Methylococcales bacterium]|nr:amidohydrolase family protein [Methylococcales bacterium]